MTANINNIPQCPGHTFSVFSLGDHCGMVGWSDIDPGTVIKVSPNGRRVTVQEDKATLLNKHELVFHQGGFAAHCSNQSIQKYAYDRDERGVLHKFSLKHWRGRYVWTRTSATPDGKQALRKGWRKFYDYNF